VPLHSHKFTATVQRAQRGSAPILTRIETQTGHGMGKPAAMVAAEYADMLAFAAHYTGLPVPPEGTREAKRSQS
jgi:prolyl oligopeptidase